MSDEKQDEGQVSEVSRLKKEPAISDGDSVAGQPDRGADEGPTGPDAPTFAEEQDHYPKKDEVETTG
jgi:hypothetical protein